MGSLNRDSLRAKYENIRAVLPDIVVILTGLKGCFHRQDAHVDESRAICRKQWEWSAAEVEDAPLLRNGLCKYYFEVVLDDHAQRDDGPVEYRDSATDSDTGMAILEAEVVDELEAGGEPPRLTTTSHTVIYASGLNYYHAPTENGPLRGCGGDYQRVPYDSIVGHLSRVVVISTSTRSPNREQPSPPRPTTESVCMAGFVRLHPRARGRLSTFIRPDARPAGRGSARVRLRGRSTTPSRTAA